ncbi:Card1-like endonuclease domain-containing protein [Scytonema sp. NUACC26]|uniref:Card1-like endonuclease domain-containing protein n=1 Tax=Scytonema sp. NUACC26 TaxID=3140176 RepID=UPI0034DBCD35
MNAPVLDKYKVDHLFLLVGENPLPNYVAARTLLKDSGTVYLVFTNQTKSQKSCLLGVDGLRRYGIKIKEIDLANYESNAYHIRDRIRTQIKSLSSGNTGLNYTGGTKAMAVHAYKAIQELKPDAVFSYLDSRHLKMFIDREGNQPIQCDVPLELELKELFKLHNNNYWLERKPPRLQPCLPNVAAKFASLYQDEDLSKEWRSWCEKKLYPLTKNREFWKNEEELKQVKGISTDSLSPNLKSILRSELDASANEIRLEITQKKGFDSLTQVCEWLDGTWLESHVLQQVKEIEHEFSIKESMMSFHIQDAQASWRERFEFDVAFIKNYQLFAISCTTSSSKKLCKQKLFEAHLRARQLGGDEARVALVCYFDRPEWIKDDMRFAIDDRKIEVFGLNDINNLADNIADWIDRNNQEAKA